MTVVVILAAFAGLIAAVVWSFAADRIVERFLEWLERRCT